ncbi:MAG TPA: YceI family protein [Flavipsychrobacter sp.]|nr:YceI family protein [Flavipsychrobacter sp.]
MKKIILILSAFLVIASSAVQAANWTNDKAHSQLMFTVKHLGISDVSGTFNDFDVNISADKADFSDAVFELTVSTASIDTRVEARNKHLKSADFFNVEQHPTMYFKSTSVKKTGKNSYRLTGNLTLHGVTRTVAMNLTYRGTVENAQSKKPTAGFQLTGVLKRSDFEVGNGFPPPMISDEVHIKADGEFLPQ